MIVCPVCGFHFLPESIFNHGICPSCGTEFGYDDARRTHEELRIEWLANGGEWFDRSVGPPPDWDPLSQVMAAFYPVRLVAESTQGPVVANFELDIPIYRPTQAAQSDYPVSSRVG